MLLSIITINLNNKKGLKKTFDSVFKQTCKNFEYIVIDGASTDGSKKLINQYASQLNYWVSEPDKGIYHAMNKGINGASGKYLLFLNSGDSLYEHEIIEKIIGKIDDADVYYTKAYCVYTSKGKAYYNDYPKKIHLDYLLENALNHQNCIIKKALLKEYGGYDENYKIYSDHDFIFSIALQHATFNYLEGLIISNYCVEGISVKYNEANREWDHIIRTKYPHLISKHENIIKKRKNFLFRLKNKILRILHQYKVSKLVN